MRQDHLQKQFKCPLCNQMSRRTEHLARHVRVHSGEKPYVCPVCSKEFSRPDKVQEHQLVHVRRKHLLVVKAGEDGEEKVEVVKVGHDDQQLAASTPDHEDDEESPESE